MLDLTNAKSCIGFLVIKDSETNEIVLEKQNAIHFGNLSVAIAKAMAGLPEGHVRFMAFGNGGSSITTNGTIFYRSPVTSLLRDETAALYNETYVKDFSINDEKNNVTVVLTNPRYADIIIKCTLDFGEPAGQELLDNASSNDGDFVFDEIAIKSNDATPLLLTHVIFHPVQKSLNRSFEIEYTIRIQMG